MATDNKVRTFNPKKVIVTFGTHTVTAYLDGEFINVKRNGALFESRRGADGSKDRINKNANDFVVEITVLQTSITNDVFTEYSLADQASNSGILPLTITDLSGTTQFYAAEAWISEDPEMSDGNTLGERKWTLETGPGVLLHGSNN